MPTLHALCSQHNITQVTIQELIKLSPTDPILDCRPFQAFKDAHLIGSTSIDSQTLFERMHELPQRHVPLNLYGDEISIITAIEFLTRKSYCITSIAIWPNEQSLLSEYSSFLESGASSKQLWLPANIIRYFIHEHLDNLKHTATDNHQSLRGLDIACGSGRDMVSLAQQGVNMVGVDYNQDAIKRANQLATSNQLDIKTLQLDLEVNDDVLSCFEANSFNLICVLRYLHRPLLKQLDKLIAPGGMIIYQTFMEGCENISSPKNPRFLLKQDELSNTFSQYHILLNDIHKLEDGRPVSAFIAQKPSRG